MREESHVDGIGQISNIIIENSQAKEKHNHPAHTTPIEQEKKFPMEHQVKTLKIHSKEASGSSKRKGTSHIQRQTHQRNC